MDEELRLSVPISIFRIISFLVEVAGDEIKERPPFDDVTDGDIFDDVTDWAERFEEVEEMLELTVLLFTLLLLCLSTMRLLLLLLLQGETKLKCVSAAWSFCAR